VAVVVCVGSTVASACTPAGLCACRWGCCEEAYVVLLPTCGVFGGKDIVDAVSLATAALHS
jgi:hypothetical protein